MVESSLGRERQLHIMSHRELRDSVLRDVDETFRVVYALLVIAVVIALLGVVNTLAASLVDRRRELGVLRAIGATPSQVARMLVVEGAMMGVVGVLTGLAAGTALSLILVKVIQFQSTGWDVPFHLPMRLLLTCVVATPLLAAAAGYLPARLGGRPRVLRVLEFE
jgi:putative ABC transport system permease protein